MYYHATATDSREGLRVSNAAIARALWLMAEAETTEGRAFWQRAEAAASGRIAQEEGARPPWDFMRNADTSGHRRLLFLTERRGLDHRIALWKIL